MSRPLRIEYPGAVYHVTARGNADLPIFTDPADGARFLDLLGREIAQQRWLCHGYCLLENHFHLLVETPEPNLGRGMGRLTMTYSQWFNRRHARRGHLFAGRYKSILFEKDAWLLALCRHVVLNPVRLNAVNRADQWRWSSYRPLALGETEPGWLYRDAVLAALGGGADACDAWRDYVEAGLDAASPWDSLRAGHYLGGEAFLKDVAARIAGRPLDQVPRAAARPARPTADAVIAAVADAAGIAPSAALDRRKAPDAFRAAVYLLRRAANLRLAEVARMGGVSPGRVSQIQRAVEDAGGLARAFPWTRGLDFGV